MSATTRQTACNACADSKRRCEKQFPTCRRCLETGLDCVYPESKKRKRQALPLDQFPDATMPNDLGAMPDGIDWSGVSAPLTTDELGVLFGNGDFQTLPTLDLLFQTPNRPAGFMESTKTVPTPISRPWFLADEAWTLHHRNRLHDSRVAEFEMEPFIRAVEGMLQAWATDGSNGFIHSRLYKKDMPTSVQDAFTTFAAYSHRTPATREIVLQIAEDKAASLIQQQMNKPTIHADSVAEIRWHLARVHALFVYVFIRLFDGSVRLRASAERQIPTLRAWVAQMREAARSFRGSDTQRQDGTLEVEREYDVALNLWQLWYLTESVRRSCLIVDTVVNTYDTMTKGSAECTGSGMFTARRGLWETDSPLEWLRLSRAQVKAPLLAPSLEPGSCIEEFGPDELDDFARMVWTCSIGAERLKGWAEMA